MARSDRDAAERLLEAGHIDRAVERFRALLVDAPDEPVLRARLAEAYRRGGDADRAFYHFDQAARSAAGRGRDALAAEFLTAADELVPDQPEILFRLARAFERLERRPQLREVCERLDRAARSPGDRRREWALRQLCQARPQDLDIRIQLGAFLLEAGRSAEAADRLEEAFEDPRARNQDVRATLEALEARASAHPELRRPLARAALSEGEPKRALAWLVPLYERQPGSTRVLCLIVEALETIGARTQLRQARLELLKLQMKSESPGIEVLQVIGRLLGDGPRDVEVLEVCAHALAALGRNHEAAKLWMRLVELHHAASAAEERDQALIHLLRAAPNDPHALARAGTVLAATGRASIAEALARRARTLSGAFDPEAAGGGEEPPPESETSRYGRGLSWPARTASRDPGDTLEDLGVEPTDASDTEDLGEDWGPTETEEIPAGLAAAAALEASVTHLGNLSQGGRADFELRFPSGPPGELTRDLLTEDDGDGGSLR